MKDDRIEVRVPADLKQALLKQAAFKGLTISEYINQLLLRNDIRYLKCGKCGRILFDKEGSFITGAVRFKCDCGQVSKFSF